MGIEKQGVSEVEDHNGTLIVKTSGPNWAQHVADLYRHRTHFVLEDDANLGIDPRAHTLLRMGLLGQLSRRQWSAVLISLGIAGAGAWLLLMAVLDPEPYSKIGTTIITGAVLLTTGGLTAVRILVNVKPPTVRVDAQGRFEIEWS
jgi:hypothetical protein